MPTPYIITPEKRYEYTIDPAQFLTTLSSELAQRAQAPQSAQTIHILTPSDYLLRIRTPPASDYFAENTLDDIIVSSNLVKDLSMESVIGICSHEIAHKINRENGLDKKLLAAEQSYNSYDAKYYPILYSIVAIGCLFVRHPVVKIAGALIGVATMWLYWQLEKTRTEWLAESRASEFRADSTGAMLLQRTDLIRQSLVDYNGIDPETNIPEKKSSHPTVIHRIERLNTLQLSTE